MQQNSTIGIGGMGLYIPKQKISIKLLAEEAHYFPEIVENAGMKEKCIADEKEHPSTMALAAAKKALKDADCKPSKIDLIIFVNTSPVDYLCWTVAFDIQHKIEAENAYGFDIRTGCEGILHAIKISKDIMLSDSTINTILVVTAEKFSTVINMSEKPQIGGLSFSDGGGAFLLERNCSKNEILSFSSILDGSANDLYLIQSGGTRFPTTKLTVENKMHLQTIKFKEIIKYTTQNSLLNYIRVIKTAIGKSDYSISDIDFIITTQTTKIERNQLLENLNLSEKNTIDTLKHYGHMGNVDFVLGFTKAVERRRLKKNDILIFAGGGAGFIWSSTVIKILQT